MQDERIDDGPRFALSERWLAIDPEMIYEFDRQLVKEPTAEQFVHLLVGIRDMRANLATLADRVEKELMSVMGERKIIVPGVGEVAIRKSTRRTKWQNDDLMRHVVARALDERILDIGSGEYESEGSAVARVLGECARPNWRLEPLRARGIDPDDWCDVDDAAWSVQLPGSQI